MNSEKYLVNQKLFSMEALAALILCLTFLDMTENLLTRMKRINTIRVHHYKMFHDINPYVILKLHLQLHLQHKFRLNFIIEVLSGFILFARMRS